MSICVNFLSTDRFEPSQIFDELMKRGEAIMITSNS